MSWVNPTGNVANGWTNPTYAYNDDTGNAASYDVLKGGTEWSPWLELTISAIDCDKVRIYSTSETVNISAIQVDVYYGSQWNNIYDGALTVGQYVEYNIGSSQSVTAMRMRYQNDHKTQDRFAYVHDSDFNEVPLASSAVFCGWIM